MVIIIIVASYMDNLSFLIFHFIRHLIKSKTNQNGNPWI